MVLGPESPALDFINYKQQMINKLRDNLAQAQARTIFFLIRKEVREASLWVTLCI
jgi:hypothetical protein